MLGLTFCHMACQKFSSKKHSLGMLATSQYLDDFMLPRYQYETQVVSITASNTLPSLYLLAYRSIYINMFVHCCLRFSIFDKKNIHIDFFLSCASLFFLQHLQRAAGRVPGIQFIIYLYLSIFFMFTCRHPNYRLIDFFSKTVAK